MAISSLSNFSVPVAGSNETLLMPKLKYRFRITFSNFGIDADTTELTKQVAEASRPKITFENKIIDVYNSRVNYAGKWTWGAITLKLRDDVTGKVSDLVGKQNQKQFDFFEQSSAASAGDYKFMMIIEMLDGGNAASFKEDTSVIEKWECYGCYLTDTSYNALAYNAADAMTIDLTIQPDTCVQIKGGSLGTDSFASNRNPGTIATSVGS